MLMSWRWLIAMGTALSLGCAVPASLPEQTGPGLQQVLAGPAAYRRASVRWGGRIARVENLADYTEIEVVAQPLTASGRPRNSAHSAGRFIARLPGFFDPVIYAVGKRLTVTGILETGKAGAIGEYSYTFPVVAVNQHQLWPEPDNDYQIIYFYDPFPDPFWFNDYYFRHPRVYRRRH